MKIHKKNIHGYIIVTILSIGLLCNFGCQIQYFKQKYPNKKLPFIFTKLFNITCPLGTCSKYLKFEEKSVGLKMYNSYTDKKPTNIKTKLEQIYRNIENIKNKIHTKYMGQGTIFLVISLYLAFI